MKRFISMILIFIMMIFSLNTAYGKELNLSGQSYILIDTQTGRILYERDAHRKMPMASTTKIMTALVALENSNMTDKVIVQTESVGVEGSSIYLREGEVMSLKDMLYGLMLRSGNDAAEAIAIHVGGSVDEFIALMNQKAKSLGAFNTNFTNPHGLHNDHHYTTAYDLAMITRAAFSYDEFANIVKSKSYTANREINEYFYNKNKTLWEYAGGNGVKTGYTTRSGRCLVSSASKNGMDLIAVCLNASNWFNDNYKLLDYGFENYKEFFIYDKNQLMKKIEVLNANKKNLYLVSEEEFFYPLKEGERDKIKIAIEAPDEITLPIMKGDVMGYIYTYLDGQLINKGNLVAKDSIRKLKIMERFLNKLGFQ